MATKKAKAAAQTQTQDEAALKEGVNTQTTPERAEALQAQIASLSEAEVRAVAMEMTEAYVDAHANWMAAEDANCQFEEANNALQEQLATAQDAGKASGSEALDNANARIKELENEVARLNDSNVKLNAYAKDLEKINTVRRDSMGIPKPAGLD